VNDIASLKKAMEGSDAVFALTNYWEKMDKDLEIQQGHNLADAAVVGVPRPLQPRFTANTPQAAGVKHYIWSTLTNITKGVPPLVPVTGSQYLATNTIPATNGALPHVYHFDSKADVADYVSTLPLKHTFFQPGCYLSNVPGSILRQSGPSEPWVFALPVDAERAQFPTFDTADGGKFVKAIVLAGERVYGKNIYAATEYRTPAQMLDDFRAVFPEAGRDARHVQTTREQFMGFLQGAGLPEFAAEELYENWAVMEREGYYGGASLDESVALVRANGDELTTWAQYLKKTPAFKDLK